MKTKLTYLLSLVFIVNLNLGCNVQQKREDQAFRFMRDNPAKLAELCADKYPVKEKLVPGKIIHTRDTSYLPGEQIPCPEPTKDPQTGESNPGSVTCPPSRVIDNTTTCTPDTVYRENTARIAELTLKLAAEHDLQIKTKQQLDDKTKAAKNYRNLAGAETALLLICGFLIFRPKFL